MNRLDQSVVVGSADAREFTKAEEEWKKFPSMFRFHKFSINIK